MGYKEISGMKWVKCRRVICTNNNTVYQNEIFGKPYLLCNDNSNDSS